MSESLEKLPGASHPPAGGACLRFAPDQCISIHDWNKYPVGAVLEMLNIELVRHFLIGLLHSRKKNLSKYYLVEQLTGNKLDLCYSGASVFRPVIHLGPNYLNINLLYN